MSDEAPPLTPWQRHQAKEIVAQRLGLISMVIWVVGVLLFMIVLFPSGEFRRSSGGIVGGLCFVLAALPWLGYWHLVERVARQQPLAPPPLPERSARRERRTG